MKRKDNVKDSKKTMKWKAVWGKSCEIFEVTVVMIGEERKGKLNEAE